MPNGKLNILHISDLHIGLKHVHDVDQMVAKLGDDIAELEPTLGPVDLICFTGDLTNRGKREEYDLAFDKFLTSMLSSTSVAEDCMLIVPGNHDVDRDLVRIPVVSHVRSLETSVQIAEYLASLEKAPSYMEHIYNFIELNPSIRRIHPLAYTWERGFFGRTVGVAGLNSAWATLGGLESDRGNLIVGNTLVEHAYEQIADCDLKIAMFHHPLDWLREDDLSEVRRTLGQFDLVLHGHRTPL